MSKTATFYHAGCTVCTNAEQQFANNLSSDYDVENVHLGEHPERLAAAEAAGVKSVPAFVIDGKPYHINFGASVGDLK